MCTGGFQKENRSKVNSRANYTQREAELRAADYYASIRKPPSEWQTTEDLMPQLTELVHRVRAIDYEVAARLLDSIDYAYLYRWGHVELLTTLRQQLSGHLSDPYLRLTNYSSLGLAYYSRNQVDISLDFYHQALALARQIGDHQMESVQLLRLGRAYRTLGQINRAIAMDQAALQLAQANNTPDTEVEILGNLGHAYNSIGRFDAAVECYQQSLAIARRIDNRLEEGVQTGRLGITYCRLGRLEDALHCCEIALQIARSLQDRRRICVWLGFLGSLYAIQQRSEQALVLVREALALAEVLNDPRIASYRWWECGRIWLSIGEFATAEHCFEKACDFNVTETNYQAVLALGIARLCQHQPAIEQFERAIDYCQRRLQLTTDLYDAQYTLAAARIGQAVCDSHWSAATQSSVLLLPTLTEYRRALDITTALGVVREALRDLELIRAAGVEGLEPVFELLEGALNG